MERALCNAHARRKFKTAEDSYPEQAEFYLEKFREIYAMEASAEDPDKDGESKKKLRAEMSQNFSAMKDRLNEDLEKVSNQSTLAIAIKYFEKNYDHLTRFIKDIRIPIDNNAQERVMRNPVIGRKTWYGTHSQRGARTASIIMSLVESCKMLGVNPREYFPEAVNSLLEGGPPVTPNEFKKLKKKASN